MKVLHLTVSGGAGGIETLLRHYTACSVHENHVAFLWQGGETEETLQANGIPTLVLNKRRDGDFKTLMHLTNYVSEERFDAVVSHNSALLLKLALLWLKLRFPSIRIFTYAHANAKDICGEKPGLWLRKFIHRAAFLRADGVIAVSESVKQSLVSFLHIPAGKIQVIYNGTPLPPAPPVRSGTGSRLIFAGRLIPEKGVALTLQAMALLPETVTLDIVGNGPEREPLEALADRLRIRHRARFLGTQQDVFRLLAQADIFVHSPRWEEGFGLAVLEAMACGCICVCARTGALPELITHGENGFLVEPQNPAALARGIEAALDCDRERVSQRAILRARDFSDAAFAGALDAYLAERTVRT